MTAELEAAALSAGAQLRASSCSASKACLTGGGATTSGAVPAVQFVEKEPETTPGAILAKLPGRCPFFPREKGKDRCLLGAKLWSAGP